MLDKNSFNEREQAEIDAPEARRRSIYKFVCFVLWIHFRVCFFNFISKLQEDYDVEVDRKHADFDRLERFKIFRANGCCNEMCFCFTNKVA